MSFRTRMKKDLDFRAAVKRWTAAAAALLAFCVLTLVGYFVPLGKILPAYALPVRQEGEMRFHFLSVGQGDCTVAEFPDGGILVVDAGDGGWDTENKLRRYLKALRPHKISYVATHADGDHIGGMSGLIRTFGADALYLPVLAADTSAYRSMIDAATENGATMSEITRYTTISGGGAYAVCLSPYSAGEEDANDASVVLWFSYAGVGTLLCGDISSAREKLLRNEYTLFGGIFDRGDARVVLEDTRILKVAHHGSDTASCAEWLGLLGAEIAVVSCGRGNGYGHPAAGALSRLTAYCGEVLRTDELGDIMVTISPDGTVTRSWGYC